MTFTIPDSFLPSLKGYRTIGAGLIALVTPFLAQYVPWIAPDLLIKLAWACLPAAIIFSRLGSKNDAAQAVEAIKTLLETPIQPEALPPEK